MAKYKPGHKDETRRTILKAASKLFREHGVENTTIPAVMEAAGLTVGGFYKHFQSKDELFREAMLDALSGTSRIIKLVDPALDGDAWRAAAADLYLTEAHRDNRAFGCAFAALSGDLSRADPEARQTFETALLKLVGEFQQHIESGGNRDHAWRFLSLLLGGLILSRAVESKDISTEILNACRTAFASI